jgi:hypothetical protein
MFKALRVGKLSKLTMVRQASWVSQVGRSAGAVRSMCSVCLKVIWMRRSGFVDVVPSSERSNSSSQSKPPLIPLALPGAAVCCAIA